MRTMTLVEEVIVLVLVLVNMEVMGTSFVNECYRLFVIMAYSFVIIAYLFVIIVQSFLHKILYCVASACNMYEIIYLS